MDLNVLGHKVSKKDKKKKRGMAQMVEQQQEEIELANQHLENGAKKKKRKSEIKEEEIELDPLAENSAKKKKKRKSEIKEEEIELDPLAENTTPKFGRQSKGEVNNNTMSPSKSDKEVSDSSFSSPKESKKKKRKSSEAVDTSHLDIDTTVNSEFELPLKKMKIGEKNFIENCEKLLSLASEQVSQDDSTPYHKVLPNLDFAKMAEHFPGMSPNDVKEDLEILLEGTVKIKPLPQLLNEALEEVDGEKTLHGNFQNFVHINSGKILEQIEKEGGSTQELFKVSADMWKKLSQKEKNAYSITVIKKKESKPIGQTAIEIFHSAITKKEGKITINDSRRKFKELSTEKKIKFIRKSAKVMMKSLQELEEKQRCKEKEEEEEDGEDSSSESLEKKVKGPSKDEVELYLQHYGYPSEPPICIAIYYCEEKKIPIDNKSRLMDSYRAFHELSKEKQEHWRSKHKKILTSFKEDVEEWKNNQDEITLFVWKTFKEPAPKVPKKKENKASNVFKVNEYIQQLTYHDVQVSVAKFDGEPVIPPMDPIKVFGSELEKRKQQKFSATQIKAYYEELDNTKKETLKKTCEDIRKKFIEGLKDYVRNLTPDQRHLFLGVNRVKYIRALREDIFEKDYPHTEYKAYLKPRKTHSPLKPSKGKAKPVTSRHSPNEEGTDEDDMEDFQVQKSKSLQPRNYSSRKEKAKNLKSQKDSDDEEDDRDSEEDDDDDESDD